MKSRNDLNRRSFLQRAGGAAVAFPYVVSSAALGKAGATAASERITVGCIGVGPQGTGVMRGFLGQKDAQVVAVCDVKSNVLQNRQELVNKHYKGTGCKAYKDFRYDSSPETWLIRITINRVRDHLRGEKLRRLLFLTSGKYPNDEIETVADRNPSPHEKVSGNQLQASLSVFQLSLKGRQREVFALRFGNGYSIKEISELISMSQSSVKTHLYRALDKARAHLSEWSTP